MTKYFITGIAGTGKSTVGNELKKENFKVIDLDEIDGLCHWRHKETGEKAHYFTGVGKDWLDAHEWICDKEKLISLLESQTEKNIVVVGISSNQKDFFHYFNQVFLLLCSKGTFIERLNSRNEGNNFGKNESEQEQILTWYENFQKEMLELGATPINTEKSVAKVAREITSKIRAIDKKTKVK